MSETTLIFCENCEHLVPLKKMRLHKVACKRLFARCPHCNTPVLKDEMDEHIKFAHPPEVKKAEVTEVQKPAEEPVT